MVRFAACLALLALAPAAAAQPADSLLAEARTRLEVETPGQALDRVHRSLRDTPDDAALLALKLRLELDGAGMDGVPGPAQRQQHIDTARRLVAVEPGNALANDVLGRAALREFLFFQHMINVSIAFGDDEAAAFENGGVSPQYIRARFARGRFDVAALEATFRVTDASGPAVEAAQAARRHLETALATDPAYRDAAEPLVALLVATGAWSDVLDWTQRSGVQFPEWGEPLLWAGLAQYRLGDVAGAEATFRAALARLDAAGRVRYEDIADLLTLDERDAYRADPEAFAQAFWAREDVRLLTPANERRAEHVARRTEADLLFGWSLTEGIETPRGETWARYGAPGRRTLISGHFYAGDVPFDLYEVWEYDGFRLVFEDPTRSGEYRRYSPSALAFSDVAVLSAAEADDAVLTDNRLRREAPQASTYAPARRERVPFLATPFRGDDGRAEVVVAFGVPLAARPAAGTSAALSVETGVFALQDGQPLPVAERRRTRASLPASETIPLGGAAVWVGAETLRLAPGAYTLAAEFSAPGDVAGFERGPLVVPAFTGGGLELSGLLLAASAEEGAAGPLVRRGVGIVPAPLDAVSGRVSVYAEAYGLALTGGRSNYEVELALVPEDGRGTLGRLFGRQRRGGVSTASEAQGVSADEAVVLSLDASGQRPGVYTLALRVTDRVSGAVAETSRRVTVE